MDVRPSPQRAPVRRQAPASARRRSLIKFGLFGVGSFILGKILGPSITIFGERGISIEDGKIIDFKNFRVVEKSDGELGFYDRLGNEILVMDHDDGTRK
jgi:hypothetical protein